MIAALLSPKVWIAIAFAALLAFCGVQQVRVNNAHAELAKVMAQYDEERARAAEAARVAEQEAREEEQRREKRKQEIVDEAEGRTELARAAARDADAAATSLRERLAAFTAAVRGATRDPQSAERSKDKQGADALDMLVDVLQRVDGRAGELAAYADRLRIAGLACEASYDGLRP